MSKSRKTVSLDWAIKKLLRSKADFVILEGFLSELLYEDIKIIELLESESNKESTYDKFNRVDLKIKNSKEEIIILELQFDYEYDYFQRILYGSSKVLTEHIKVGSDYGELVKVISVNILYFDIGLGEDYVYHGTTQFFGIHNHEQLKLSAKQQKLFNKTTPSELYPEYYLIKVNGFDDVAKNTLDEWVYFFKNSEIKDDFTAKGLKEAYETLAVLNLPDDERAIYNRYEEDKRYAQSLANTIKYDLEFAKEDGVKIGIEKGKLEGKLEGEKLKALEIAKKALLQGISIDVIQSLTGLPIEDIKKLRE
jgi:predicted transposase/invertase (TIGR01784 family)